MICTNCGNQNKRRAARCAFCGKPILPTGALSGGGDPLVKAPRCRACGYPLSQEYRPLSPWAYLGYMVLFSVPLIGWILLIVFSLGGTKNTNLKNFARSYWCGLLVLFLLLALAAALLLSFFDISQFPYLISKTA